MRGFWRSPQTSCPDRALSGDENESQPRGPLLIYGGHNLIDVLGGMAITLICWRLGFIVFDAQLPQTAAMGAAESQASG
ncbi:hypothetical protein FJ942_20865 [Mesorhizobium sp. B2-4-2]|nr:hypothetical protein FJ437_14515 [Mesorhizobium sp. B2-6-6]TPK56998.1 hypothetical protein FJ550_04080 [Mesorhizobium sp. B2-5-2]TPL20814.1 hypothetical protein FJ946_22485 [Mesorhizobium sp. B2-4-7]TPL27148.1 hypothetical protein FJ945_10430 [Mesorhizobium sp. B2-4-9]TPL37055.1 hypothetical protein FJ961_22725 [Mesorhizobium sp. B2-4-5]TPL53014.1 hypothetical protein FJ942_20865 [Mesorhizobium sp. B2-4-2]TPM75387.1 hypothetical protein FJ968_09240 [Mesorhizobium sp. B2-1-6]TPN80252.1 hyp